MSSEQQILNLLGQYSHYIDKGEFEKVGELFDNGKIIHLEALWKVKKASQGN